MTCAYSGVICFIFVAETKVTTVFRMFENNPYPYVDIMCAGATSPPQVATGLRSLAAAPRL